MREKEKQEAKKIESRERKMRVVLWDTFRLQIYMMRTYVCFLFCFLLTGKSTWWHV